MNIYEALKGVPNKKRLYFLWKFNLNWDQTKRPKSEPEFLKMVGNKTLNGFLSWEKTEEYRNLVAILLNTRFDSDLEEIYDSLSHKAKEGDEKSIKLLLQIGKEIKGYAKEAVRQLNPEDDDEDDLML
ncbi:hypothetical protein M3G15_13685 [Paenibacillus sp. p3-SID1389]|uniref:hypothetical protein n=1 Tax=Paenibacillus sp. p3-SID1389 TaxID=2916364 RepID=UPI0021A791E5|nr:hypothetical protein [Paenibacillus sp. p3-SID1389]MCT2196189.1 hypothetical protein [Paenibacillus sp. p3-SID1389]